MAVDPCETALFAGDLKGPPARPGYAAAVVTDATTYVIELVVGLGCLALAAVSWRKGAASG